MAQHAGAPSQAPVLRGLLLGLVCGLGAFVAHGLGGGAQASGPVLGALLLGSVGVGLVLARQRLDLEVLIAAALLTQGANHLTHMVSSGEIAGAGVGLAPMLFGHTVVAIATVALARGADQAVGRVISRWWQRWFEAPSAGLGLVVGRLPVPEGDPQILVRRLPAHHVLGRAPPVVTRSVTPAPA